MSKHYTREFFDLYKCSKGQGISILIRTSHDSDVVSSLGALFVEME